MLRGGWTLRCSINRLATPGLVRLSRRLQLNPALLSTKVSLVGCSAVSVGISGSWVVGVVIALFGRRVHGRGMDALLLSVLIGMLGMLRLVWGRTASPASERVWVAALATAAAGSDASA